MEHTTTFELDEILTGLLEATRHLKTGLRHANPSKIHEAAVKQVECLQWLEQHVASDVDASNREQIKQTVRSILEINQHNQKLSRSGLQSIRSSLHQMTPPTGYGDDGYAQRRPISHHVSAQA